MKYVLILLSLAALGYCATLTLDGSGNPSVSGDVSLSGQLKGGKETATGHKHGRVKRFIPGRGFGGGRPVIANQNSQATSGFGGTSIATGAANAVNRRGGGAIANQNSNAISGAGGVSIADGSATAVGGSRRRVFRDVRALENSTQPKLQEPKSNKTATDLPKSRALEAPKANQTVTLPVKSNATSADLLKPKARALESPLKLNSTKTRQARRHRGGSAIANQQSIAQAGKFGTADASGSANAQSLGGGSAIANQHSVATAGLGGSASAESSASASARFRRSPIREPFEGGHHGRPTIVNQHSSAHTGADGTAIAHGTATGQGTRGGGTIVNQSSHASGGAGSTVIADGSATATGSGRGKRASGDINDLVNQAVNQAVKTAASDPNAVILSSSTKVDSTGGVTSFHSQRRRYHHSSHSKPTTSRSPMALDY